MSLKYKDTLVHHRKQRILCELSNLYIDYRLLNLIQTFKHRFSDSWYYTSKILTQFADDFNKVAYELQFPKNTRTFNLQNYHLYVTNITNNSQSPHAVSFTYLCYCIFKWNLVLMSLPLGFQTFRTLIVSYPAVSYPRCL